MVRVKEATMLRIGLIAAILILAAFAIWHPAPQPAFTATATAAAAQARPPAYTARPSAYVARCPVLGRSKRHASNTKRTRKRRRSRPVKTHAIVNVNTASADELATVPGIGATIAARIVAIREQDGTYTTFDELLDVAGMSQSRLDRATPYLQL
jgi:competence ComEA-like helix-hairpin-helix protein